MWLAGRKPPDRIFPLHFHQAINRLVDKWTLAIRRNSIRGRATRVPLPVMEVGMIATERRRTQRYRTLKAGHIAFNRTSTIDCRVRNMSPIGACLVVPSQVGIPNEFTLFVEYDKLKRRCRVIWRTATQLGIEFVSDTAPVPAGSASAAAS